MTKWVTYEGNHNCDTPWTGLAFWCHDGGRIWIRLWAPLWLLKLINGRPALQFRAAVHELHCRECRVTWKSWMQRAIGYREDRDG